MDRDIRDTAVFREAAEIYREAARPGEGSISDIADLALSPLASQLLFTGTVVDDLDTPGSTRIGTIDLATGATERLTDGPNSDHRARTSPNGTMIAFLSDRHRALDFQLYFLDWQTRAVTSGARVDGWVEYFEWSPNGQRILLGVADHGAELSSGEGAFKTNEAVSDAPSWMPHVTGGSSNLPGRAAWIYDVASGTLSRASGDASNIWEASWCGDDRLAVVTSPGPDEGAWYAASLAVIEVETGQTATLYKPTYQIGVLRSSPVGDRIAFIEAVCSDRGYVAGDLRIVDLRAQSCRAIDTDHVDVTSIEWRSDTELLVAGHRGLETVILAIDLAAGACKTLWQSTELTTAGAAASVLGLAGTQDFAFVAEGFSRRPRIATVTDGSLRMVGAAASDVGLSSAIGEAEHVHWRAPDGLLIEGWLIRPQSAPPYPLILEIHGGPVLHWRPYWLGRSPTAMMLLRRGYAIFLPNPRGSSGRGQAFAARIIGDVGGADTADFLSGVDHLVASGIADGKRLGVMGLSYGGLMTCWLTTQDTRFAAAIAIGPATNHVSHHLTCNIPQFVRLFLGDHYTNLAGAYHTRSPILHAHKSKTPTLLICGARDRCTPPGEAVQYHNSLLENGIESVVLTYPEEGHGIHGMPAAIDFAARCVMWFERHLSPQPTNGD